MMMARAIQITNILKCLGRAIKLASKRGNENVILKHETQTSHEGVMNERKTLKTANTR